MLRSRLLLDLRPGVFKRQRAIKDQLSGSRIRIQAEVPHTLKLEAVPKFCVCERRLQFGACKDLRESELRLLKKLSPSATTSWDPDLVKRLVLETGSPQR